MGKSNKVSGDAVKALTDRERMLLGWMRAAFEASKVGQKITPELKAKMREVNGVASKLSALASAPREAEPVTSRESHLTTMERAIAGERCRTCHPFQQNGREGVEAAIARLWPNGLGPKNLDELVVFVEEERKCEAEYRVAIDASFAALSARTAAGIQQGGKDK